jgi:prophage regulatory protein
MSGGASPKRKGSRVELAIVKLLQERGFAAEKIPDDIVLEKECRQLSKLSPTSRWRLEQQGKFPKRFKVGDPTAQNGRSRLGHSGLVRVTPY